MQLKFLGGGQDPASVSRSLIPSKTFVIMAIGVNSGGSGASAPPDENREGG